MGRKTPTPLERFTAGVQRRAEELSRSSESETPTIPREPKLTANERRIRRALDSMPGPGRGTLPD